MEIRRLAVADARRCAELEQILFPGDSPWPVEAFLSEFALPSNLYIGVFDEDVLVGYAGLALLGPPDSPEFEVHTIGVDPTYQRQGIGRAMMTELMAAADEYGGPVFLEVRTDNVPAIKMYESFGFVTIGTRRRYYQPSGADAFTMRRESSG